MLGNFIRTLKRRWELTRLSPETRIYWRSYTNDPPCTGSYIGLERDGKAGHLLQQNYTVEIPSFRMRFFAGEGKVHMQSAKMTDWVSIPEMRTMFLKQSDFRKF